jgi:outer membrane protein, multidrug efflux system
LQEQLSAVNKRKTAKEYPELPELTMLPWENDSVVVAVGWSTVRRGTVLTLFCLAVIGLITACAPFSVPDRARDRGAALPESYSLMESVAEPPQQWWLIFHDSQLNGLIDEALRENLDLAGYWARLEKAQALAGRAGSEQFPEIVGEAAASHFRSRTGDGNDGGTVTGEDYSLGIFAGYEVDLWGRVRAAKTAAGLSAAASREDLEAAAMTVAAETARRWVGIIARQREILLLGRQLETNQVYLELVELRFQKSLASALDVMQQRQLVERVRAQIPLAEMREQLLRNELAVLTGRLPHELPDFDSRNLPEIEDPPAAGLPAGLLDNRPDIRAALRRLEAADQNFVAARADRLPALRLTGSASFADGELTRIFDNWLAGLAAGLTAPLVDGGRLAAAEDFAAADVREQLALYRGTVLTAVREVEESLTREAKIREHIRWTQQQLQAANSALSEARFRYMNGLNDYLPVLTQLLSVQNLEMDLIARKEDLLTARIDLYRAVGSSWPSNLPFPARDEERPQDRQS